MRFACNEKARIRGVLRQQEVLLKGHGCLR